MPLSARKSSSWVISAVLLAIMLVVFAPVRHFDFISLDDPTYVANNSLVRRGMSGEGIAWAFSNVQNGNWIPLAWISHMLSVQLFGLQPGGHHLVNLALHIANVLLLFRVLARMTGARWPSALVALLFAIHPLHVESVAWVSERKDVLSTCFLLLALLAYLRGLRRPGAPRLLPAGVLFALGLMAKPMLVTMPLVFLLLDFWPLGRLLPCGPAHKGGAAITPARLVLEKAPLFLLSAAVSLLTLWAQSRSQAVMSVEALGIQARAANAALSYLVYLGKTLWPQGLAAFYPYAQSRLGVLPFLANVGLLAGITAGALAARKRFPYLACGWLWYLGTLVPVIGLVQAGLQARADRYTYVPLIGIFIVAAWAARDALARRRALLPAAAALAVLLIGALAVRARSQVEYWRDNLTLFQHNLDVAPDDAMSLKNLGIALAALGKTAESNRHLARAYELNPALRSRSFYNLGRTLAANGKHAEAARSLREALRISPAFFEARVELERILAEHPDAAASPDAAGTAPRAGAAGHAHESIPSPLTRGDALARVGKYEDAVAAYREAIRLQPELAGAYNNLGCALAALGRRDEAGAAFREAIRLQPDFSEAQRNLARTLGGAPAGGSSP